MKTVFAIVLIAWVNPMLFSQSISHTTISSAGATVEKNTEVSLSWTLGQVFNQSVEKGLFVTEGFQQGLLIRQEMFNEETTLAEPLFTDVLLEKEASNWVVFPTMVKDQLFVKFNSPPETAVRFSIVNLHGEIIYSYKIPANNQYLFEINNAGLLPTGMYFLQVNTVGVSCSSQRFYKY